MNPIETLGEIVKKETLENLKRLRDPHRHPRWEHFDKPYDEQYDILYKSNFSIKMEYYKDFCDAIQIGDRKRGTTYDPLWLKLYVVEQIEPLQDMIKFLMEENNILKEKVEKLSQPPPPPPDAPDLITFETLGDIDE